MQYVIGIIFRDNDYEIIGDDRPGKGSYMGLGMAMHNGVKMIKENPNIKQINIYSVRQGQRVLDQQLFSELRSDG